MREPTFHIYLDESEYSRVINSLVSLKNSLIQQGRYTDAVDDVLCKFLKAKQKKLRYSTYNKSLLLSGRRLFL